MAMAVAVAVAVMVSYTLPQTTVMAAGLFWAMLMGVFMSVIRILAMRMVPMTTAIGTRFWFERCVEMLDPQP